MTRACLMCSSLAAALLLTPVTSPSAHAALLIGAAPFSGGGGSKLYSINPATGAATLIAPIMTPTGPLSFIGGLEWNAATGTLYAYTADVSAGKLYTVNPTTGAAAEVGPLGFGSFEGGLAFSPGGVLYGVHSGAGNTLLTIDTTTGAAAPVGSLGPASVDMSGIAFSPTGALYGVDMRFAGPGPDQLHSINPATGAASFIGFTLTDAPDGLGGLDFNPDTGALYLTDGNALHTVLPATGAAGFIGGHGVSQMSSIVFIPEPHAGLVLLIGALAIVPLRR